MDTPKRIGKYDIQGILGKGGMGVVYRAFDPAIQRQVAIKTITKSTMDASELQYALTRFRHEAQAVGRLTHSRIAAIYDYGEDSDLAYIVMELVNGDTLYHHMQNKAQFGLKEIGEIIRQLLDGLDYAHNLGVVHRDIKPSNILVNDDGRIKISDFGIARLDTSTLTQVGEIMGSPSYMSPEQIVGTAVDARTDIYSVGVIAYELLTGTKPFSGSNLEVMRQAMNDQPANPSDLNTRISVQLDWATLKALAKKPKDRFQTAREFSDAFTKGIKASLRIFAGTSTAADDSPTQRINPSLLNAARVLSGVQPAQSPALDMPAEPKMTTIPGGALGIETSNKKDARVLFVDDEERILTALRSVFRSSYHVFTATNGPEALEFVKKFKPHVIVSDQRMPDMLGVELLRQAKEVAPNALRILLTGYSDLAAIVGSINDGEVFRFISKPWDNQEIRKIMAEAVAIALELADTATVPPIVPDPMTAGILVVDPDQAIFRATKELFGTGCLVYSAKTLDEAFSIMALQEIGLVLADIENGGNETIAAFKLLKQEHPEILTIALTATSDSELVIELINEAQIFRFLNKPVNLKLLKQHAQAAMIRYQSFKQTPALTHRHRVESAKIDSTLSGKIIGRVRSIKGWFGQE
jgi:serine/threonine-protein kinase